MSGTSKVIVLDPDGRACRQVGLGFEREGVPVRVMRTEPAEISDLELFSNGDHDASLVVVGGTGETQALELIRRARNRLDAAKIDAPIVFAGRGVRRTEAEAAGADEVVLMPAHLRDLVTIGRLLRGQTRAQREHLIGSLAETTGVFTLVRALAALGRSATLTLIRGLRRGEVRFYHGEVTSAQVGLIHGQAALHQLLLWTDARFDFQHEDVVRRQQIPLSPDELFADAERFLTSIRDSSGLLSPSMVLEQDVARIQSHGKQVPSEVYGVLRMFDGHRVLADVLEDSPYRVFETLRVTQRAVEAGLLREASTPKPKATWRAVLAIEEWLVGGAREEMERSAAESGPLKSVDTGPHRKEKDKRKRKKRGQEPLSVASKPDIDWGALVPRIVGAEIHGTLAGVVPASHTSGEIMLPTREEPRERLEALMDTSMREKIFPRDLGLDEPKIIFDEAGERASLKREEDQAKADAEAKAAADKAEQARITAEQARLEAKAAAEASAWAAAAADAEARAAEDAKIAAEQARVEAEAHAAAARAREEAEARAKADADDPEAAVRRFRDEAQAMIRNLVAQQQRERDEQAVEVRRVAEIRAEAERAVAEHRERELARAKAAANAVAEENAASVRRVTDAQLAIDRAQAELSLRAREVEVGAKKVAAAQAEAATITAEQVENERARAKRVSDTEQAIARTRSQLELMQKAAEAARISGTIEAHASVQAAIARSRSDLDLIQKAAEAATLATKPELSDAQARRLLEAGATYKRAKRPSEVEAATTSHAPVVSTRPSEAAGEIAHTEPSITAQRRSEPSITVQPEPTPDLDAGRAKGPGRPRRVSDIVPVVERNRTMIDRRAEDDMVKARNDESPGRAHRPSEMPSPSEIAIPPPPKPAEPTARRPPDIVEINDRAQIDARSSGAKASAEPPIPSKHRSDMLPIVERNRSAADPRSPEESDPSPSDSEQAERAAMTPEQRTAALQAKTRADLEAAVRVAEAGRISLNVRAAQAAAGSALADASLAERAMERAGRARLETQALQLDEAATLELAEYEQAVKAAAERAIAEAKVAAQAADDASAAAARARVETLPTRLAEADAKRFEKLAKEAAQRAASELKAAERAADQLTTAADRFASNAKLEADRAVQAGLLSSAKGAAERAARDRDITERAATEARAAAKRIVDVKAIADRIAVTASDAIARDREPANTLAELASSIERVLKQITEAVKLAERGATEAESALDRVIGEARSAARAVETSNAADAAHAAERAAFERSTAERAVAEATVIVERAEAECAALESKLIVRRTEIETSAAERVLAEGLATADRARTEAAAIEKTIADGTSTGQRLVATTARAAILFDAPAITSAADATAALERAARDPAQPPDTRTAVTALVDASTAVERSTAALAGYARALADSRATLDTALADATAAAERGEEELTAAERAIQSRAPGIGSGSAERAAVERAAVERFVGLATKSADSITALRGDAERAVATVLAAVERAEADVSVALEADAKRRSDAAAVRPDAPEVDAKRGADAQAALDRVLKPTHAQVSTEVRRAEDVEIATSVASTDSAADLAKRLGAARAKSDSSSPFEKQILEDDVRTAIEMRARTGLEIRAAAEARAASDAKLKKEPHRVEDAASNLAVAAEKAASDQLAAAAVAAAEQGARERAAADKLAAEAATAAELAASASSDKADDQAATDKAASRASAQRFAFERAAGKSVSDKTAADKVAADETASGAIAADDAKSAALAKQAAEDAAAAAAIEAKFKAEAEVRAKADAAEAEKRRAAETAAAIRAKHEADVAREAKVEADAKVAADKAEAELRTSAQVAELATKSDTKRNRAAKREAKRRDSLEDKITKARAEAESKVRAAAATGDDDRTVPRVLLDPSELDDTTEPRTLIEPSALGSSSTGEAASLVAQLLDPNGGRPIETPALVVAETPNARVAVADHVEVTTTDHTARLVATPIATITETRPVPDDPIAKVVAPVVLGTSDAAAPFARVDAGSLTSDATPIGVPIGVPIETTDEPSDGVIRESLGGDSPRVKLRPPPVDAVPDDRPDDTTGEITSPLSREQLARETSNEPSILVADLAAIHTAVSAVAVKQAAAPHTGDPSRKPDAIVAQVTKDAEAASKDAAVAFSDLEEDFFRQGLDAEKQHRPAPGESFDDLDEGFVQVGFWDRLLGRKAKKGGGPKKK